MTDKLYKVLGVSKSATDKEISAAYRKLAKQYHPDLHPGDKAAEEKFRELSQANEILGDKDKRARYDRGEIDEHGKEKAPFGFGGTHGGDGAQHFHFSQGNMDDLGDVFSTIFGGGGGPAGFGARGFQGFDTGPQNARYRLDVSFLEAANGAKKHITLPDGKTLNITIPAGTDTGQTLRLKGQGPADRKGRKGDALIEITVKPHRLFKRNGLDIEVELPISIDEAVLGAKVKVPTVHGPVTATVPKGSNTGSKLRLKGKGVKAHGKTGDQYVKLSVMIPDAPDKELEAFLEKWRDKKAHNPRAKMESV